jgi:hypothetical protein
MMTRILSDKTRCRVLSLQLDDVCYRNPMPQYFCRLVGKKNAVELKLTVAWTITPTSDSGTVNLSQPLVMI